MLAGLLHGLSVTLVLRTAVIERLRFADTINNINWVGNRIEFGEDAVVS